MVRGEKGYSISHKVPPTFDSLSLFLLSPFLHPESPPASPTNVALRFPRLVCSCFLIFRIRVHARLPLWFSKGSGRQFGWLARTVSRPYSLPLPPPCDARLFPIYSTCGDIGGFYVYTRLAFLSSRGSFALVVYTTVMLISCSRERPARGFCCYRGVYIFLPSLQCSIFFG